VFKSLLADDYPILPLAPDCLMSRKTKDKVAQAVARKSNEKETVTCQSPLMCWDVFMMFVHERKESCPIQKRRKKC
jgi:hypothetical protein